jgi:hypothetical protein
MVEVTPDISTRWGTIKKALVKAAKTGSRLNRNPPSSHVLEGDKL